MVIDTDPPRGASLFGVAQVTATGLELPEITGIVPFDMKLSLIFSSCMLVAPGIMSIFMGDPASRVCAAFYTRYR
jgi:hypothetical protein